MYVHYHFQFNKKIVVIQPGESYVSNEDIIISTVLGSCVSVVLLDLEFGIGGMNHFMLPGIMSKNLAESQNARYGMYAMDLLISDMQKKGARRSALVAKVFGGGSVLGKVGDPASKISKSNIDFSLEYLKLEGIPIKARDTGGDCARKILFFVKDRKVLLKRYGERYAKRVEKEEEKYLEIIQKKDEAAGNVTLF